jgi:uncharacterized DUF497 family protein
MMRYIWDERKRRVNIRKHGIDFEDATRIFDGPTLEKEDARQDYSEIRIYAIGIMVDVLVTVIYTERGDDERHIISAWKAEPHEQRAYYREVHGRP